MRMRTPELNSIRPISDIPNQVGFNLRLVAGNGGVIYATVGQDANGCHVCFDGKGNYRICTAFAGWIAGH
jgi:hypothetical protein